MSDPSGKVSHGLQVVPDHHQMTARKIGTWNVHTLLQAGKLDNLKQEMKRMEIYILGESEM